MRVEEKTTITKTYIADDGQEFSSAASCKLHEEMNYIVSMFDYVYEHAVENYDCDDRYGVAGFIGCDGWCGSLVKVDDTILEWADWLFDNQYSTWMRGLEYHKGEYVFLIYSSDQYDLGSWSFDSTFDEFSQQMAKTVKDLRTKIEKKEAEKGETNA